MCLLYMKSIETDVNAKKPEKPDMTRDDLEICQDHLEATVASEPTPKGLCTTLNCIYKDSPTEGFSVLWCKMN